MATHQTPEGDQKDHVLVCFFWLKLDDIFKQVIHILIDRHPYICCWKVTANIANF